MRTIAARTSPADMNLRERDSANMEPMLGSQLLAPFPVLSSTQFCFEVMAGGRALDVGKAAALLGKDPGAVLRLYAAVAHEYPNTEDRPERLEECLVSLSSDDLLDLIRHPPSLRSERAALISFAQHGAEIAHYALAAASALRFGEDQAYLVGLFHSLEELPRALGRVPPAEGKEPCPSICSAIARQHQLPAKLRGALEALHETQHGTQQSSIWIAIIRAAHDLSAHAKLASARRTPHDTARNEFAS